MKASKFTKNVFSVMKKHSPGILTGIGIAGMLATTIMAVQATPKALPLIEDKKEELRLEKLPVQETIKATWKCYIPAAVTGVMSIACIAGASSVNARRNAAIATAYTLSETALREYKDKVVETTGEKKEKEVQAAVAKGRLERNPVQNKEVVVTERGNTIC